MLRDPLFATADDGTLFFQGTNAVVNEEQVLARFESSVSAMMQGDDDSLWVTTLSRGVYRFKQSSLTTMGIEEGLPVENLYPIHKVSDESIWVGAVQYGAFQLDVAGGLRNTMAAFDPVNAIAEVDQQTWLVGLAICVIDSSGQCDIDKLNFLSKYKPFYFIHQDQQGRVWLAGRHGSMWLRVQGQWQQLNPETNNWYVTTKVQTVLETPDGAIWFGTNGNGLIRFQHDKVTNEPSQWGLKSRQIRSMLMINDSQMLVGTMDQGLCLIHINQANSAQCINQKQNLKSVSVHHLHKDAQDRIWWSSNRGVFWQSLTDLLAVLNGEMDQLPTGGHYDKRSGMRNAEANGGVHPSALIDGERIWYPTQQGMAIFDLNQDQKIPAASVHIESVKAAEKVYLTPSDALTLAANQRSIQVKLTALSYFDPSHIEFKYRLPDESEQWIELGQDRLVNFNQLPAGLQRIEFAARNKDGNWQNVPTHLTFTIQKHWYETLVVKVLAVLAVLLILVMLFRWRHQLLLERAKRLEDEVRVRTQQLKQLSEKRTEFFANISHELRTPLTLILGPMQDALDKQGALIGNDLKLAHNSAQRMKRLVDQMLDLQKIDAEKLQLQQSSHDLLAFLTACIEPFQMIAKRLDIQLYIKHDTDENPAPPHASIDSEQMEKVMGNLLSNAFKFSPANSDIKVTLGAEGKNAIIAVLDDGPGLEPGAEKRIFNRFSQEPSNPQTSVQGTGIGLALAKEIVELHEGTISAENRLEGGACFVLSLPLVDQAQVVAANDASDHSFEAEPKAPESLLGGHSIDDVASLIDERDDVDDNSDQVKILVVEDNADIRHYIGSHLQTQYRLVYAEDGLQGLAAAKRHIPDIIISDVMMPNMNGFEMARSLRNDPCTDFIPFIFLTAKAAQEDELKGFSLGADDYINKPFTEQILLARINAILEARKRLQRSMQQSPDLIEKVSTSHSLKDKAELLILQNLGDPSFNVVALADALYMSRSKLHRQLNSRHATTPSELLRSVRMSEADKLLRQGVGSVSEVCCAVGYSSLSSFSNVFKRTYGVPPASRHQK